MKHATIRWYSNLVRVARKVRRAVKHHPAEIAVGASLIDAYVDKIVLHADGIIAAVGWSKDLEAFRNALALSIDGTVLAPTQAYRLHRADLAIAIGSHAAFWGSAVEWGTGNRRRDQPASLDAGGRVVATFTAPAIDDIAYVHLHTEPRVLHRENIYSFGPPVTYVSHEILTLARQLPGPVLDFGCGAGALVRELRRNGVEAYGLELDDERIRQHLLEEVRPWVTLYDGRLPAPFRDRQFRSVCCSEVLEHIADPERVVQEIGRLAADRVLITVPDISAIPRGYPHHVVPWHLLESTHVNFFTQASLQGLLAPIASRIEIARLGQVQCDQMSFYTSLAALVDRQ